MLVQALGQLQYSPATETLINELGGENHEAAVSTLQKIAPAQLEQKLLEIALDRERNLGARSTALVSLVELRASSCATNLIPLLNETVVVAPAVGPGIPEWRMCDFAAMAIARLLEWDLGNRLLNDAFRDELLQKARDWAASLHPVD